MIRHVVLFRFKEGITDADIRAIDEGLAELPALVPEIHAYRHGRDLALADANWDYAVVGDFASVEDYRAYSRNPDHIAVIGTAITPIVDEIVRVQFEY